MANNTKTKKKTLKTKKTNKASAKSKKKTTSYKSSKTKAFTKDTKSKQKTAVMLSVFSVLIIAAVIGCVFLVKGNSSSQRELAELNKDVAWGVDISSHNGKIDWKKVSNKADFAFIRVGYRGYSNGKINLDKQAKSNLKAANKNGIPVGVYFYSQAINKKEAVAEARFLIKNVKGYKISLPLVIDFEYAYKNNKITGRLHKANLTKKEKTALINAFCDTVREAGYTPGVYASSYIYRSHLNMKSIPSDVFIWVADYNKRVTYKGEYDFWQYSEKGKCEGVNSKYVDTNYFYTKNRLKNKGD